MQAVRDNGKRLPIEAAVDAAVDFCIEEGYISDFLERHRREVKDMTLTEYDEEKLITIIKNQERMEGQKEGRKEGRNNTVLELASTGDITEKRGAEMLEIKQDEFDKLLKEFVKNHDGR